jgi:NAD(P)-dependent dehydrogenase (short-subunit alcohol dehydrogenase family)
VGEKVAVITGSSSGIGMLSAIELASRGFRVVASMRDPGRRERLDTAAQNAGVRDRIDVRQLDITKTDSLPPFVSEVLRDLGRIDVLVNNAGFPLAGFAEDIQLAELREQFDTNFFGHVALTKAVLPAMRTQRSGHVIMISSISGRTAPPTLGSYASSKFALEGWSESLRMETHSVGIRVVLVEPGAYDTDIWTRNARLGEHALDGSSPNAERARRFRDWVANGGIKKRDAREVARLIARVAEMSNPKLRYLVGPDARMQLLFKTLLPWRWYERLAAKAMKID